MGRTFGRRIRAALPRATTTDAVGPFRAQTSCRPAGTTRTRSFLPHAPAARRVTDLRALVMCEGHFGDPSGKTAHGLVRYSDLYRIVGVIDSTLAGRDAAEFLDGQARDIPIFASLDDAFARADRPTHFILGIATDGGRIPEEYKPVIEEAIRRGLHVVSGLHEKLNDQRDLVELAQQHRVTLTDVRTVPPREQLHFFTGKADDVTCPVIAVLGTDSAIGKRTTARILVKAMREQGYRAVFIGTGQTGRLQGARYSMILDSLVNDFVTGEVEHLVYEAWQNEDPDLIVIEGQGSLTHPAYPGGFEILAGGRCKGAILQHAPGRATLDGFPQYPMPDPARDLAIAELLMQHPVIAFTINHENLTREQVEAWKGTLAKRFGRPATDPLFDGAQPLVDAVVKHFDIKPRGK